MARTAICGEERTHHRSGVHHPPDAQADSGAPASFGNLNDFTVLRNHTLRALCGALMDRHSECSRQHPFCGPGHDQDGGEPTQLVAKAVPQRSGVTGNDLIGVYLYPARSAVAGSGQDILEYVVHLSPTLSTPAYKLVVPPAAGAGSTPR